MPVTANRGLSVPTPGTESGTWGSDLNANTFGVLDTILGGTVYVTVSNANITMTPAQCQNGIIRIGGTITTNITVGIPTSGVYAIRNETVGNFNIYVVGPLGPLQMIPVGTSTIVHVDAGIGAFVAGQRTPTVGMIAPFVGVNAPNGWYICDGSMLARSLYPNLWAFALASGNIQTEANWYAGSYWGAFSHGDGSTNFRIPDLRGWFPRAWAGSKTYPDPGRVCGTGQGDGIANHVHPVSSAVNDPTHVHGTSKPGISGYNTVGGSTQMSNSALGNTTPAATGITVNTTMSNNTGGIAETRPVNIALVYCISLN